MNEDTDPTNQQEEEEVSQHTRVLHNAFYVDTILVLNGDTYSVKKFNLGRKKYYSQRVY